MLTQEQIDAFAEAERDNIRAAHDYARRSAEMPKRPDRWTAGTNGGEAVARGILAQHRMIDMLSRAFAEIWNERVQAGADAMRLHDDPPKRGQ